MHSIKRIALAAIIAAAPAFAPAFAQDSIGTLQVQGQVMTSTGGEFAPASSGDPVVAGERVLVGEGGQASVQLADGGVLRYSEPGVYTVQVPAAAGGSTAPATTVASAPAGPGIGAIVAGAVVAGGVIAAASGGDSDDDSAPPVSR